ncbi:MAG: non-heme iron oxygenase ferredoxin subunit [Gammaproteobacteria bacterium]|nr:non-heme iron oxygenase ferredoxin subunit [Gammaproteobacteria bacterium]
MFENWLIIACNGDVEDGDGIVAEVENREVAVFRCGRNYYATDVYCTHAKAPLVDGYLDGVVIECPLHQGRFDIRNGKVLCSPPTKPLTTYPTRVVDNKIQIQVD